MLPDERVWWRMCPPCARVEHGQCQGGDVWCECVACVMLEVEEMSDE